MGKKEKVTKRRRRWERERGRLIEGPYLEGRVGWGPVARPWDSNEVNCTGARRTDWVDRPDEVRPARRTMAFPFQDEYCRLLHHLHQQRPQRLQQPLNDGQPLIRWVPADWRCRHRMNPTCDSQTSKKNTSLAGFHRWWPSYSKILSTPKKKKEKNDGKNSSGLWTDCLRKRPWDPFGPSGRLARVNIQVQ